MNEEKKWFRKTWFKILTFICLFPLWAIIVWTDPKEKRGVKIFGVVLFILWVAFVCWRILDTEPGLPRETLTAWEQGPAEKRLQMLSAPISISSSQPFTVFDCLVGKTRSEVKELLGSPDALTDQKNFIYRVKKPNQSKMRTFLIIRFDNQGKASEKGIRMSSK